MRVGTREIGPGRVGYVIAEIGVNHDGDVRRALELVELAAHAGVDAVKFQLFRADLLMGRAAKLAAYQKAAGEHDPIEMLRRLELSVGELSACAARARDRGVHAIVSVFSTQLVREAEAIPWDAYKSASPDIVHKPLLLEMMRTGRPMIVSTGASTPGEIARAVGWLAPAHDRLALLQCVSSYPTPLESSAMDAIVALGGLFRGVIGYSDHCAEATSGAIAVAFGAEILEKHFTYSKRAPGPDHRASLEPAEMAAYVRGVREMHEKLGRARRPSREEVERDVRRVAGGDRGGGALAWEKRVLSIEEDVRRASRQSLTATRRLDTGHVLAPADLTVKRPGTGIPACELERVIGRRLARGVDADMPLGEADLGSVAAPGG